jgi:hypothetical protein
MNADAEAKLEFVINALLSKTDSNLISELNTSAINSSSVNGLIFLYL